MSSPPPRWPRAVVGGLGTHVVAVVSAWASLVGVVSVRASLVTVVSARRSLVTTVAGGRSVGVTTSAEEQDERAAAAATVTVTVTNLAVPGGTGALQRMCTTEVCPRALLTVVGGSTGGSLAYDSGLNLETSGDHPVYGTSRGWTRTPETRREPVSRPRGRVHASLER